MWREWVLPRLEARGLGHDHVSRTYRLAGIGESAVADILGEEFLRRENPEVATYARVEAVDVRISAHGEEARDGVAPMTAKALVAQAEAVVLAKLGQHVWGREDATWADAIGAGLAARGWTLSSVEIATGGSVLALLGDHPWLRFGEVVASGAIVAGLPPDPGEASADERERRIRDLAQRIRAAGGSDVGLAVDAHTLGSDTEVLIGVATPTTSVVETRTAFLGGQQGRARAALNAAAVLWRTLTAEDRP